MKPTITIHNIETGEVIEREMNAAELKQVEADKLAAAPEKELDAENQAKKTATLAKLEALGLDIDDLKVLGLG